MHSFTRIGSFILVGYKVYIRIGEVNNFPSLIETCVIKLESYQMSVVTNTKVDLGFQWGLVYSEEDL